MGTHIAVVIAAAGSGQRLGGAPKQFRTLGKRPLVAQSALPFERHPRISSIVVVVPEAEVERVRSFMSVAEYTKLHEVVSGGRSRMDSVAHGLAAVPDDTDFVVVHDAARPFVAQPELDAVIEAALQHGAASLAVEMTDTLRKRHGDQFGEAVDRTATLRVQTPQAFRADLLRRAHAEARRTHYTPTDDASLIIAMGSRVMVVPGSNFNIKITTPDDWLLARAIWPGWKRMWSLD